MFFHLGHEWDPHRHSLVNLSRVLGTVEEARQITEEWHSHYNEHRLHEALNNMTPVEYKEKLMQDACSSGLSVPAAEANPREVSHEMNI